MKRIIEYENRKYLVGTSKGSFIKNHAYVYKNSLFVYKGEFGDNLQEKVNLIKKKIPHTPFFIYDKNEKRCKFYNITYRLKKSHTIIIDEVEEAKDVFEKRYGLNIYDLSLEEIAKLSHNADPLESNKKFQSKNENLFRPEMKPNDSYFISIIKAILNSEDWTNSELSSSPLITQSLDLSNLKSAILKHDNISLEKFDKWMKLLNKQYTILIADNNDKDENDELIWRDTMSLNKLNENKSNED